VIPYGHTVTLELAGYSISQEKSQTAHYEMILVDGNLTIQDSVGGGLIKGFIFTLNGGKLTIEGGTFETSVYVAGSGSAIINNGIF
jgi:hypothetical protein